MPTQNSELVTQSSIAHLSGWAERRGQLKGLALIAATLAIFWLLFRRIDLQSVVASLQAISPRTWALATILTLTFPVWSALRWQLTLQAIGHRVPFSRCVTIILGLNPVNAIAPSKAGDLLKAVCFRGQIGILEVGGTVFAERALDIIVLALLAVVGGIVAGHTLLTLLAAAIAALGIIGLLLLPLLVAAVPSSRLRDKLERAVRVLHELRRRPTLALGIFFYTAVNWLASIVQTQLLLSAVGAQTPFWLTTAVVPIAVFVGLFPVTLGGMGTRDAAFIALLGTTATPAQGLTVALLYSFFGYWLLAVLGLPFLRRALFPTAAQTPPR